MAFFKKSYNTYCLQMFNFDGQEAVLLVPAHPASFANNFFSRMQSFYFSESQDAMVLQAYHEK